ncbi:peptide MFS transporter [Falsibacillus pallidus]|uniref:POT family proton-dependent oligopeptide transporter n=1 Tax=Falsibacillus pallidus TaxID=493781 RepID=A0A370GVL8_9BACI|nr:peptide MFS transporter [Falsibacillus pallidus]RDI47725.1 POT family proton-dependent oligopeptide transporter [Falsibacillus pallidus]
MEETLQNNTKKHPKGLYLLFFTELWERYSYYGMRSLLVLYLTIAYVSGGLGMDDATALRIYGLYTGLVYFTPLIGGYLTDRFIGLQRAITIGGITMACGDFTVFATHSTTGLYIGLLLLIIGNGFFKPNISTLVGELYPKNDKRKDAAFTIFYMGINIGAFFAPLIAGFLAETLFFSKDANGIEHWGFQWAFLASSIGMLIGQIIYSSLGKKYLGDIGKKPLRQGLEKESKAPAQPLTPAEKKRTWAIIIITCFVVFFWAGFEQAGSSFTLYTQKFVDRNVFGFRVPVSWFQSINPVFIIILAPILSAIWSKLSNSKRGDIKMTTKMGIGMILLGIGFLVLIPAVLQTGSDESNIPVKANLLFIVFTYFLHTLGELFLSPVGLSLVSKVSPVKLASLLMGVWLFSSSVANFVAGQLAALTESLGYLEIFLVIGAAAIVLGLVLLSISRKLVAMMESR